MQQSKKKKKLNACCIVFVQMNIYSVFCLFLAALRGMLDISSPSKDKTPAPCIGNMES